MKKLLALLLLAIPAQAQTIVTGTIVAPNGAVATSGYVEFKIVPSSSAILYRTTLGVLIPTIGRCGINASGLVKNLALTGDCTVYGNDNITPANTAYDITFAPNNVVDRTIRNVLISGVTYNLATPVFAPIVTLVPQYQTYTAPPFSVNLVPAADNAFSAGLSNFRFSKGWFTSLDVTGGTFTAGPLTNLVVSQITSGNINGILLVCPACTYTAIQPAINALPAAGGVIILQAGNTYDGPTNIPSGVTIIALGAATPGGSMSFTQPAYTTKLTYSSSLTIGPAQSIGLIGVTLDFTGANTLTISSVQNSVFDMVVRSATGSPAVTFTSTVLGGANYWNRYPFLQVITGGAVALQWTSPATSFVTNNHYGMLVPVLTGTTGKALSFVQNCDSNYFENVKAFWTNAGAVTATGVIFNDSATPAANTGADYIKISWMDFTFSGTLAGGSAGLAVNKSTGNVVTIGVGIAAFPTTVTYTGNPDVTIYDPGGGIVGFGSGSVATNFTLAPSSGTQTNTTRLVSGNPSGGIVLTMPVATDTLVGRATTDTLSNKGFSDKISKYNNITTVANGIPAEYAAVDLTAQTAAITTTTLYAVPASGAGQYRLSWNAKVTTPATTGAATSTLGALTIVYTDPDGVAQTITAAAQVAAGTIATSSTGNTTTTVLLGIPLLLNAKASTNITYAMAYASDTANQMAYNLHIVLEKQ